MLNTQHFMIEEAGDGDFTAARRALYTKGVKTSYDEHRMIFSTQRNGKNNIDNVYAHECNGLILEIGTWAPLMVPPRSLRYNINTSISNKFLHQGLYYIYPANDGTCINLYYYNGSWRISTTNGYDMNNVKWDNKSYQTLVEECLSNYGLTWESFTEKLNTKHCYSFGFRHHEFHRFIPKNSTKYYMWFIQSVCLDDDADEYLWTTEESPIEDIKRPEILTDNINNLKTLYHIAKTALDTYLYTGEVCYGFILRSVNFQTTLEHSDLYIESSLMRAIRRIWYDRKLNGECRKNNWDKETACILHAYLDESLHETFIKLFPQYKNMYTKFSDINQLLTTKMLSTDFDDTTIDQVAKEIKESFHSTIKYNMANKTDDEKKRVYTQYLVHKKHMPHYMRVLNEL